jgi:hypothetical protein
MLVSTPPVGADCGRLQNEGYLVVAAVLGSAADPQRNRVVVPGIAMLARQANEGGIERQQLPASVSPPSRRQILLRDRFYESLRSLALRAVLLHDGLDSRLIHVCCMPCPG